MLGSLLALALAGAPFARHVVVYPLRHPEGRDAEAQLLERVLTTSLLTRGEVLDAAPPPDAFSACTTARCLAPRAESSTSVGVVIPTWTSFGDSSVLSVVALTDGTPAFAFELAVPAPHTSDLPAAIAELARLTGDRFALPAPGEVRALDPEHSTFGAALKLGNTVGTVAPGSSQSALNLRFDLEADYLAAEEFWPFVDLSVVLGRDDAGNRVQLVPVLLGAKYVFRKGSRLRPFVGMALGLDFLSANPDQDTSTRSAFAVYAQGGVDWFFLPDVGLLAEASANLNGLEASGDSGVLFAVGFNFGVTVLF